MITPSFGPTATERVLPRLALDFTTASLDPRVAFTRADATATCVNSSGFIESVAADTPRFDYDPVTLVCKGLLIEESRQNLVIQSEFASDWSFFSSAVVSNTTDPRNTTTAILLREGTATSGHYTQSEVFSITSGQVYTNSVYAKKGTATIIQMFVVSTLAPTTTYANFDVETGVVTFEGSTAIARIVDAGNGFYRCSMTYTATGSGNGRFFIAFTNQNPTASRVPSYAGSESTNVVLALAQVEAGAFPTSYIPTTSAAVTRNADFATMTGTNFSDWYSAGAGGVVARVLPSTVSGTRPALQLDDVTANEVITLRGSTTNPELVIVDGGSPQAQIDAGTIAANTAYNLGAAWNTNNCAAAVNGGAAVTDTTATIPTVTQARLGSDGTNYLNGHLQTLRYWPQRIINAEVQAFSK
jgi:hypothetical protein